MQSTSFGQWARTFLHVAMTACLLAVPAMGQYKCKRIFDGQFTVPNPNGGTLLVVVVKYKLFNSKGKEVGVLQRSLTEGSNDNNKIQLEVNGIPFTSDPNNPDGIYSEPDGNTLQTSLCSLGEDLLSHPDYQSHAATTTSPLPFGQAAGSYVEADFNGDGIVDSAQAGSGRVVVSLYNAAGQVASTASYTLGQDSGQLVTGDFNGDGVTDLAAVVIPNSASAQGTVAILLGKADGTFGNPAYFPVGSYPSPLAVGDFNGDHKLDLAVGNTTGNAGSVSNLLGKGDGTFSAPANISVGTSPGSIVATDLNGDGHTDLATLDAFSGGSLWVLLGNGTGAFGAPIGGPTGTGQGSLGYADLNHDGKQDLVIADFESSAIATLLGNGDGTFQTAQSYVAGAQPVNVGVSSLPNGTTALFTVDNVTNNMIVNFAAGNGQIDSPALQTIGKQPGAVTAADLNGDGKPDIVWTDSSAGALYVLLNSGAGLAPPVTYSVGSTPSATTVADVNNDGKPDLIVQDGNGIDVLLGVGNGDFRRGAGIGRSRRPILFCNCSRRFQLGWQTRCGSAEHQWQCLDPPREWQRTFSQGASVAVPGGTRLAGLVTADFNGDGKADLAVSYNPQDLSQPGAVNVFLGDGHGAFYSSAVIPVPGIVLGMATADLNKDSKFDLLARVLVSSGSPQIAIALGKGDGTFQPVSSVQTATGGPVVAITDLDGDGNKDLVLSDCCGLTEASYLLGYGDGTFQPEFQFPSGPSPQFIAVADLDGDGKPDLIIAGSTLNHGTLVLERIFFGAAAGVPSSLTLSHVGSFTQGQTGAGFTITVNNGGTAATSGTVTVSDNLPSGLTAAAMTGSGWNCTLATVSCSRSDALAAGGTYPPIFLTVNVASSAASPATNQASDSGGGLTASTATDTVTILPPFTDVSAADAFLSAIDLMREYSITSGCSTTPPTYCPNDNITRAQMAVFVVRSITGGDTFTYNTSPYFTDVPATHPYFKWVQKMRELQITSGCSATAYCPDDSVTRGQMAVFIIRARYGAITAFSSSPTPLFTDVPASNGFFPWIQKMKQVGITSGCGATTYCPNDLVTRDQMAIFLVRGAFNQLLPAGTPIITSVSPAAGTHGQTVTATLTGQNTNFASGATQVSGGAGITVTSVTLTSATTLTAVLSIDGAAAPGPRSLTATTGSEEATIPNGFQVQ